MKDTEEESGEMGNIYISSEQIIQEVQKFRCLYDTADPDHKDRDVVKDAWLSVTQAVVGEPWAKLNDAEKSEADNDLKKKWKSIKDHFLRSLRSEAKLSVRDERFGIIQKKIPHIHRKEMSFLLETERYQGYYQRYYREYRSREKDTPRGTLVFRQGQINQPRGALAIHPKSHPRPSNRTVQKDDTFELEDSYRSSHSAPQQTRNPGPENPDRMFLLSLLPRVSALNSRDKMDFQIGIMRLLQGYETELTQF